MAFSGLHVVCVYVGGERDRDRIPLPSKPVWSDAPASGVNSTRAAPSDNNALGIPVFQVYAAADSYLSIGPLPNALDNPRFLIPALQLIEVIVEPGDKFQWVAA